MRFEIYNERGIIVMQCSEKSCIPNKELIDEMSEHGYKFKLNGKAVSKSKIQKELEGIK